MNYQEFISKIEQYQIDYFLLGTKCEFDVEYLPDCSKILEKVTGFTGSNGFCFISKNKIILITDGRYLLQGEQELAKLSIEYLILNITDIDFYNQFSNQFSTKTKIGFNNKIFTQSTLKKFQNKNIEYIPLQISNNDLEIKNKKEIFIYDEKFHGQNYQDKIREFTQKMQNDFYFFNNPASICWLLNIRGFDIDHNMIFLCYGIIEKNTQTLTIFCFDENKLNTIKNYQNIKIKNISGLNKFLETIIKNNKIIGVSDKVTIYYFDLLKENLKIEQDYCNLMRSYKNKIEIENSKEIHLEDAVAFINFWYEFENSNQDFNELKIVNELEKHRKKQKKFICNNFDTIAGFNENGAIIHYKPNNQTNKKIKNNGLLLIDSGGHYYGGTTDVTRVLSIGIPTEEQKQHYTLVLKAHLKLLNSYFPKNTYMHQLNSIARYVLWQEKLDFNHGLGHGVSNCIDVHEGPYSINNRCSELLTENLILSNEPGLYFEKKYGIRIENLMLSKIVDTKNEKQFIEFENLTMIPYEVKLIDKTLLDTKEINQIKDYHKKILQKLENILKPEILDWLKLRSEF